MQLIINYIEKLLKVQVEKEYLLKFDKIPFNIPQDPTFGDLSTALPIILAKKLNKNSQDIDISLDDVIILKTDTKNGYINYFINWDEAFKKISENKIDLIYNNEKILVEHTSVNPNKMMHIGHLRNAVLGDTIAKIYTLLGANATTANYIDDTGLQMAELMYYLQEKNLFDQIEKLPKEKAVEALGTYYIEAQKYISDDETKKIAVNKLYIDIENQIQPIATQTKQIAQIVLETHLNELKFLGIEHDIFTWESDLLNQKIVEKTINLLKEKNIIVLRSDGLHKGCWVLPEKEKAEDEKTDKIIIKSDQSITYTGKDIAFALWKYNYWSDNDNNFDLVVNVIDDRQSYTQNVVKQALNALKTDKKLLHINYQVVALSQNTYTKLTGQKTENKIVMMKGREGTGFTAKQLIEAIQKSIGQKNSQTEIIDSLTKSAIRVFMLKYSLDQMIVFDIDEAIKTDGETGVYLNYSFARCCQLLAKITPEDSASTNSYNSLHPSAINLLKQLSNFGASFESFANKQDPSSLVRHAFDLCSAFNTFYDDPKTGKIIDLDDSLKAQYVSILNLVKNQLSEIFDLIGIDKLEKI